MSPTFLFIGCAFKTFVSFQNNETKLQNERDEQTKVLR